MLLTKLKLNYFGRFQNQEIELKPGINLICGENEAGKSTIHTFIKGMLFGIERMRGRGAASKEDVYTRFLPWDYPGAFGGSMDIRVGDKEYRLQRSFHANDKSFIVLDLTTGREVKLKEGTIGEIIPGLTESTFKNTISIEQLKAQTDTELAAQVRNYIANLSISKSKEVNVAAAVSLLTDQKKQLEQTQNITLLKSLQAEIAEGLEKEERMDQLTLQLKEFLAKEQQLKQQKEIISAEIDKGESDRMEQLPAMIEKYRTYTELLKQTTAAELQEKDLLEKIAEWEKEQYSTDEIKEDSKQAEQLRLKLIEQEKLKIELQRQRELLRGETKKNSLISFIPTVLLALAALIVTGFEAIGILTAIILPCVGIVVYQMRYKRNRLGNDILNTKENELTRQRSEAKAGIQNILVKYQVADLEQLMQKQEEVLKNSYSLEHARQQLKEYQQRLKDLEDSRDLLYETIMKYMQHFLREDELTYSSMQKLQEEINHRKQESAGRLAEIHSQFEGCRIGIEKLRWEIATLEGNEEQLLKNQECYQELEQKIIEKAVELEAIKLALSTIQGLSTEIHDSFGQQLNQAVSEVFSEVTGQKYQDLKVDEKLEVKVSWNGNYVLLDRLSAGTIDQVYFALRLAVADLLLGKEELPLLLDDSFALYDESRVKAALVRISKRKQIILFTCHKREQSLLEELHLPYHYIDLSCR